MSFPTRRRWSVKAVAMAVAGLFSGFGGQGGRGWRQLSPGSQYDYEAQAGDLWRNSAVAACLRVIRANIHEPKLQVVSDDDDGNPVPIPNHEAVDRIESPNDYYSDSELWSATAMSLIVDGNAFWLKVRSAAGKVIQLWWVPHWTMEPRYPADGSKYLSHYVYKINGREYVIRVEDVVHFRMGIDPRNDRLGFSELKQAVREICSDNEAAGFSASMLRNSGVPMVVISPREDGGVFGDGVANDVRSQWRKQFSGEGRGEPLVTDSVKVERLGFSPKDLQLGDLPDRFEDRIAAAIGVNPMVAGLTSGASHKTFANYGEARRAFYEDTLIPLLKAIAKTLTRQLLVDFVAPPRSHYRWSFKAVQCLRENENDLADRVGVLYHDKVLLTLNQALIMLGEKPVKGGDKYADGSTPEEGPQKDPSQAVAAEPPGSSGDGGDVEAKALIAESREAIRRLTRRRSKP